MKLNFIQCGFIFLELAIFIVGLISIFAMQIKARGRTIQSVPAWSPRLIDLVFFLCLFVLVFIGAGSAGVAIASRVFPDVDVASQPVYYVGFSQVLSLAVICLALLFYKEAFPCPLNSPDKKRGITFFSAPFGENIIELFCAAIAVTILGGLVSSLIPIVFPSLKDSWGQNQMLVDNISNLQDRSILFLAIPAITIFTPVIEELFFRAGIYRFLKGKMPAVPAAIITGIIFAGLHDTAAGLIPLALFSCALCYAYERTGSIVAPIIIHCIFNTNTIVALALGIPNI